MERATGGRLSFMSAVAGIIYGCFIATQAFGSSGPTLILGGLGGLILLGPAIAQMVLTTAGILIGKGRVGPTWTEHHERKACRMATVLLVLVILSGLFGLIFAPVRRS